MQMTGYKQWTLGSLWKSGLMGVLLCSAIRVAEAIFFSATGGECAVRLVLFGLAFTPDAPIRLEPFPQTLTVLSTLVFWFWFGSEVKRHASLESSLVMARGRSRRTWALIQIVYLGICSLIYSLLSSTAVYLTAGLIGGAAPVPVNALLLGVILETPILILGATLSNLLSFRTDALVAYALVAGTHVAVLLLTPIVVDALSILALLLPSSSGLTEVRTLLMQQSLTAGHLPFQGGSYVLQLLLVFLASRALIACVRRCDLL